MTDDEKWALIRNGGVVISYSPINQDLPMPSGRYTSLPIEDYASEVTFVHDDGNNTLFVPLAKVTNLLGLPSKPEMEWIPPNAS